MKVYAVIDTNVLVSALYARHPDSAPLQVLEHIFSKDIIPMYNAEILAEYDEVLHRPRFAFRKEDILEVISAVTTNGISSQRVAVKENATDPKDVVFLEVAMSRNDSYLVTGNIKHFPVTPRVVTPNEVLEFLSTIVEFNMSK